GDFRLLYYQTGIASIDNSRFTEAFAHRGIHRDRDLVLTQEEEARLFFKAGLLGWNGWQKTAAFQWPKIAGLNPAAHCHGLSWCFPPANFLWQALHWTSMAV